MSSFLDKLNKRGVGAAKKEETPQAPQAASPANDGVIQIDVDVQQSLTDITIVAPVPGVDLEDVQISLEGEGDIVVLQGEKKKPEVLIAKGEGSMKAGETAMFLQHENKWGQFYRKIVLPVEIEPAKAQATLGKGILTLVLPLKNAKPKATGRLINVVPAA